MTVSTQELSVCSGGHVVHFYEHDAELAGVVGRYLAEAIRAGGAAVAIATPAHGRAIEHELASAAIDPALAADRGALVLLDAAATLERIMPHGRLGPEAFRGVIGSTIRDAAAAGGPVHAYGEMVALLWDAGDVLGALDVEGLWNDLAHDHDFALLCGYRSSSVSGPEHAQAFEQVCEAHSSVLERRDERAAIEVSSRFPGERDAPRAARHFVTDALRRAGHDGTLLVDAQIVLSELAANAVLHACSGFSVAVRCTSEGVRLAVGDTSPVEPTPRDEPEQSSGRGIRLVAALATNWGVDVGSEGKTIWAELVP
jgi:anti-sigma regulatory factor (Ser/Thr protein kinase)